MYDVEKLVSIVCDYLDAEADYMKYSLDARKELGLAPNSTLWIPSLNGSKAYRLGELFEKSGATGVACFVTYDDHHNAAKQYSLHGRIWSEREALSEANKMVAEFIED